MQRRKHRRIDFGGPPPETARMVMDEIEGLAFAGASSYQINHPIFMLSAPPLIIVGLRAGLARGEQLSAHPRFRRGGNGGPDATASHFALQRPQDLLRAAR